MLATILIDKYKKSETKEIAEALKLLTIENQQDWSTAGIYCYWDYYKKEILYIGLAVDLLERFKQHNGISKCNPKSCKLQKINDYFSSNEYIGFSIILQSSLSQPVTQRQIKKHSNFSKSELIGILGKNGANEIKYTEGILIEGFNTKYNRNPKWNVIGGSTQAQSIAKGKNVEMLNYLITNKQNRYTSRVSLKELSKNNTFCRYEAYLHSLRISILPAETVIEKDEIDGNYTMTEISKANYFKKHLDV